jgi:hypothetical protein
MSGDFYCSDWFGPRLSRENCWQGRGAGILLGSRSPVGRERALRIPPAFRSRFLLTATLLVGAGGLPRRAGASDGPALEARGGLGVSSMLSAGQRDRGFRTGFVPDVRPALRIADLFVVELEAASWFFPHDSGTGRATLFGGGLRFDPRLATWLTWFVDGHGGVGLTGPSNRPMIDAGTGFDLWIRRGLALGPYVRYGQVFDRGPDPRFWAAGLGATLTWDTQADEPPALGPEDPDRERRQREWERTRHLDPHRGDRDGDGITDDQDICPDEKPGPRPDPNMRGCPLDESRSPRP